MRATIVTRGLVALAIVAATSLCGRLYFVQAYRVPQGVTIGDTSLSALRWSDARHVLAEYAKIRSERHLMLRLGGCACSAQPSKVGIQLDIDKTLLELSQSSQKRSAISKILGRKTDILPEVRVEEPAFSEFIETCEKQCIDARPVSGRLEPKAGSRDGSLEIVPPKTGTAIDVEPFKRSLRAALVRLDDGAISIPTTTVSPRPTLAALQDAKARATAILSKPVILVSSLSDRHITLLRSDLSKLLEWKLMPDQSVDFQLSRAGFAAWLAPRRHRLEEPARNATFEVTKKGTFVLVPEAAGRRIATDSLGTALEAALHASNHTVDVPYEPTKPATLSSADIEHLNIHELVSSFTTHHACCQPRVNNIHRIADLLNGAIVLPGATFSLNEFVGPRTLENGFVAAPSIQDGDMLDSIGGGISQFATTFYNAAMRGGYEILERQAHSYWFDRYPMGHEATLTWPKPDLVIRNDTAAGLLIVTAYDERSITVKFYGDREGRRVSWGVSGRFDIVLPKTEYLPNLELEPDKEKVKEGGCIGWSVTTTRSVVLKDNTKREDKRKIIYKPRIRRVEVHPCKIPEGEPGATGEKCPKPKSDAELDEAQSASGSG